MPLLPLCLCCSVPTRRCLATVFVFILVRCRNSRLAFVCFSPAARRAATIRCARSGYSRRGGSMGWVMVSPAAEGYVLWTVPTRRRAAGSERRGTILRHSCSTWTGLLLRDSARACPRALRHRPRSQRSCGAPTAVITCCRRRRPPTKSPEFKIAGIQTRRHATKCATNHPGDGLRCHPVSRRATHLCSGSS